jgi:hypothetical protein
MQRIVLILVFAFVFAASHLRAQELTFPPLGDRYKSPAEDATAVLKALSKLQARTEIAINFRDYDKAVADVYPDVRVFLDSVEARTMPEVRMLFANAMTCFLKVQSIWSTSITSDSPAAQYDASILILTARPALWKTAAANVAGARAFLESTDEDRQKAQQMVTANAQALTVEAALVSAT